MAALRAPGERRRRTRTARGWIAGLLAIALAMGGVVGGIAPAALAAGDYLQIDKSVDKPAPQPGETFTYSVKVTCSEQDCLDAALTDAFPAQLAGFTVEDVRFTPETTPFQAVWTDSGDSTPPAVLGATSGVTVHIEEATSSPVGIGLTAGSTFTMLVSLTVPSDYPAGESGDIVNTATATSSTANTVDGSATVNIDVPVALGVDVTKGWTPASQTFDPGAASTITLGVGNDSNVAVDTLVIQEPQTAASGATALDASNPFTITDFTGFANAAVPASCTSVQVDAYVFDGAAWVWRTGPPSSGLTLPDGVANADVGGIRVTCTGTIPPGDAVTFDLGLAQRATDRNTGADLSTATHRVDNVATGSATAGERSASAQARASHTVTPDLPTVDTQKDIAPGQITAGQSATASLSATNGPLPVRELRMADLDFFTADVTFGGFTAAPVWPAGASAAAVVYHLTAGGTTTVSFADGAVPAAPSGAITGFEIVYTGTLIEGDATSSATFAVATTESATAGRPSVTLTNEVVTTVTSAGGLTADKAAEDTLVVIDPAVAVTIDKTVRPGSPVAPGDTVIASLQTRATATGDGAVVNDIVVEDAWNGSATGFWNAFSLDAVAPTQVPANTLLTIEVRRADGSWATLAVAQPQGQAFVYQLDAAATAAALAALTPPVGAGDVEGIRFTFHSDAGFPADTTVTPNVVFDAQATLRTGGPSTPGPDRPTRYTNAATAAVTGTSDGGKPLTDDDRDTAPGTVQSTQNPPGAGPSIEKDWTKQFLSAQSGEQADTDLRWRVSSGFSPVAISDPAGAEATPQDTVFDAFDLKGVRAISPSSDPYSNGWYLKYDTVTAVELYSAGSWHAVAAPGGTWMSAARGFVGYTLTADEAANTTGIRVTLAETPADTAARVAARQVGPSFDPFAPAAGSGVGSGSTQRLFALTWQLRDITRSDGSPVTATSILNTPDAGVVDNTVLISAAPVGGGQPATDRDDDRITLINQPPGVAVTKTATPTSQIFTPVVGTSPSTYPTAQWTMSAHNTSTAKASALRITDPATCAQTSLGACESAVADAFENPFDTSGDTDYLTSASAPSPFERFTATKITIAASIPGEISADSSVVWLLHYNAGVYTTTQRSITAANALTAAQLADVVGVSVTYRGVTTAGTGTITQANNLSVAVATQLRPTLRSNGQNQVLPAGQTVNVTNRVFAQSYDPVLSPATLTGAVSDAGVVLTGGVVNITPTKSIAPTLIAEPAKQTPVTVTLGANQGSNPRSTLSPNRVVIEDQAGSAEFWNTFDLVALGAVTFPAGANRVQVDVYDGTAWVLGSPAATAALPAAVPAANVQGIRFTFTRADGGLFSATLPAAGWSTSAAFTAAVRDTYRDSGATVVFDHAVTNTQTAQSTRVDGNDSAPKTASATVTLSPGTHQLAVNKLSNNGNRLVSVGVPVPFDLTFQNVGTGYLTVAELRDTLPAELQYLDTPAPVFTKQPGGLLSDQVTVGLSPDGRTITFTWPEDGDRMKPGEVFTIRVYLELQPGLAQGQRATNTMTVETLETLSTCRNTVAGGSTTDAWASDPATCGTTDYVGVVAGSNLYTVKGVRGSLPGAYRPGVDGALCQQNLVVGGGAYYRSPCVADSQVDGTDAWVLHNVNAGTIPVAEMTVFDQLPTTNDRSLISGASRGSQLRPELVAQSLKVTAPAGTTQTVQVTTSANVCVGTWAGLTTSPVCEQSGEVWSAVTGATDWSAVTGIRVHLDFRSTPARALAPGQAADVTYSTVNRLASEENPDGASPEVPGTDQVVWNQYGVKYQLTTENTFRKIAPSAVASHLRFGSIAVTKVITGPAALYAPADFLADVTCQAGGVPLQLGSRSVVTLNAANDYTARIDGVLLSADGTTCTVTEQGALGEFGETSRSGSPTTLTVSQAAPQGGAPADVPAAQIATLTNDYQFTGLEVTKRVQTEATEGAFGPFTFEVGCTSLTGDAVVFDDAGATSTRFTIEADETWSAPENRIPVGADCVVRETDASHADDIVFTGSNVVDLGDGSAIVTPGTDPAAIEVTNGYGAGTLTVGKEVIGDGADRYGVGEFEFSATCTYQGQLLLDERFALRGGDTETFGVFPSGTVCDVAEETTGGATTARLDPEDGRVTIAAGDGEDPVGSAFVTATNVFDLASFDVVKERAGNLLNPGAAGPFTVVAVCTWQVDGTETALEVPGGAARQLTAENGFRTTYADLPAGATCEVTETETQHAASTSITVDDGDPTSGTTATIALTGGETDPVMTITNTFTAGEIAVTKAVSGGAASAHVGATFRVSLACTWYGAALEIPDGAQRAVKAGETVLYTDLPTDALCVLTETDDGAANAVSMTVDGLFAGASAKVTVRTGETVALVVDNRFDPNLPSTGGDARLPAVLGGIGLVALLAGLVLVAVRRRREV